MRLFTKIFLFGMLIFGLAFSGSGYFLLHYSMESSMAREVDFALKQYQYDKFTVQSAMMTYSDISVVLTVGGNFLPEEAYAFTFYPDSEEEQFSPEEWITGRELTGDLFQVLAAEISVPAAFFAEDGTVLYSEIEGLDLSFLDELSESSHAYRFRKTAEGGSILVGSVMNRGGWGSTESGLASSAEAPDTEAPDTEAPDTEAPNTETPDAEVPNDEASDADADLADAGQNLQKMYFVTQWDISKTIRQQDTMREYFVRCYLAAMAAGAVLLGILSAFLTGPLKRMSKAARRMAEGNYGERFDAAGRDEVGELEESFNRMADAVEEKIGELSRAAREKEDFVANFAHELKTPLTSIIGYADTIYQKELSREEVRKASWNIWNEGMRLEALSLKLMEMTVLGRQDFPLEEMPGDELLKDVAESLLPVFSEKQIEFLFSAEPAYIRVDYDLLKTLLINLMDNSVKAGSTRIELQGQIQGDRYQICVIDNGCGMEEEELSRITEAFYMVDRARSRKQHGAGLGLALAERIARIHGCSLKFESRKGEGTRVSFFLDCEKGGAADENA